MLKIRGMWRLDFFLEDRGRVGPYIIIKYYISIKNSPRSIKLISATDFEKI